MTSAPVTDAVLAAHPVPDDEARVAAVAAIDPAHVATIDSIAAALALVQRALGTTDVGLALVGADHVHVVAHTTADPTVVPREAHLAAFAVVDPDPFVVEDTHTATHLGSPLDGHPHVVDGVRFFAAAPVADMGGHLVGALWLEDAVARPLERSARTSLTDAARVVEQLLLADESTAAVKQRDQRLLDTARLAELGSLSAGIAHEINTPSQFVSDNLLFLGEMAKPLIAAVQEFAAVASGADAIEERAAVMGQLLHRLDELDFEFAREEVPSAIDQSVDGIDQIRRIVRSLRDYSHPGSGDFQYADLNKAIESTSVVCRSRWKEHARVAFALDPDLPEVPCHLGEINQVIMNLIVNAADAIAETGPQLGDVTVATTVTDGFAVISVSDDGTGIPDEVQSRIFDQFFTTKDVGRGTGQGLPISRAVAEAHQGSLHFETTIGVGTTFVLRLPLEAAGDEAGLVE
ncbi:MAG: HAMP domain-containing sensor histidine kinase [Actinomycetota bacterium]